MQFQNPPLNFEQAKHCGLTAIYLLLHEIVYEKQFNFYQEVKQEIEKL